MSASYSSLHETKPTHNDSRRIGKMFFNIMGRVVPCAAVATLVVGVLHIFLSGTWISFIVNAAVFCVVYMVMLMAIGLNKQEKDQLFGRFRRKKT